MVCTALVLQTSSYRHSMFTFSSAEVTELHAKTLTSEPIPVTTAVPQGDYLTRLPLSTGLVFCLQMCRAGATMLTSQPKLK